MSSDNRSSAQDLALLVKAAYRHPVLREILDGYRRVGAPWAVARSSFATPTRWCETHRGRSACRKTGYISEAGRCLVMQAQLAGRKLIMVLLDSTGRYYARRRRRAHPSCGSTQCQSSRMRQRRIRRLRSAPVE